MWRAMSREVTVSGARDTFPSPLSHACYFSRPQELNERNNRLAEEKYEACGGGEGQVNFPFIPLPIFSFLSCSGYQRLI